MMSTFKARLNGFQVVPEVFVPLVEGGPPRPLLHPFLLLLLDDALLSLLRPRRLVLQWKLVKLPSKLPNFYVYLFTIITDIPVLQNLGIFSFYRWDLHR